MDTYTTSPYNQHLTTLFPLYHLYQNGGDTFSLTLFGLVTISTIAIRVATVVRDSLFYILPQTVQVPQVHIVCGANVEFAVGCDRTCAAIALVWRAPCWMAQLLIMFHESLNCKRKVNTGLKVVFKSPVQSGLCPIFGRTKTRTGL